MSSCVGDENVPIEHDHSHKLLPREFRLHADYSTTSSPSRLSPSKVVLSQLDSPLSDHGLPSPVNAARRNFLSTLDYEHYISTRKHFDILTQLKHRNTYHLMDKILGNLSTPDLNACSNVCRKWHGILRDYKRRQQTKAAKRNLFNIENKTPRRKNLSASVPMQTITNLLETKSSIPSIIETPADENSLLSTPSDEVVQAPLEQNVHLAASTMTFRYGYLKYLHGPTVPKRCPICAYVSIVDVNDHHGYVCDLLRFIPRSSFPLLGSARTHCAEIVSATAALALTIHPVLARLAQVQSNLHGVSVRPSHRYSRTRVEATCDDCSYANTLEFRTSCRFLFFWSRVLVSS